MAELLLAADGGIVRLARAGGRWYAGTEPSLVFASADGGETWRELDGLRRVPSRPRWSFPPRPWTHHVSTLAPHPADPAVLLGRGTPTTPKPGCSCAATGSRGSF